MFENNSEINKAAEVVRNGGVILYPTDTIWGLGCDPKNEEAIQKIDSIQADVEKGIEKLEESTKEVEEELKELDNI